MTCFTGIQRANLDDMHGFGVTVPLFWSGGRGRYLIERCYMVGGIVHFESDLYHDDEVATILKCSKIISKDLFLKTNDP